MSVIAEKIKQGWGYQVGARSPMVVLTSDADGYAIQFWPDDNPPSIAEIEAIQLSDPIQQERTDKIKELHQWWDGHPGIEVASGIVLPIQESGRNTNSSSLALGLLTQSETISLVSVDDYTVTIPASEAITALGVFRAAYDPISATWDSTHQALMAATTLEALNAVEMPV
jgi:hypothetical protein